MNLLKRPIWGRIATVVTVLWMVGGFILWDDLRRSEDKITFLFPLVMFWGVVWIVRGNTKTLFDFIKSNLKFLVVAIFITFAVYEIIQIRSDVSSIQSDVSFIQSIQSDVSSIESK